MRTRGRRQRGGFYNLPLPPALWGSGQSNEGNQDGTPGETDQRVTLFWTSPNQNNGATTGPVPMSLQNGGHSFEWQCSAELAKHFNSAILVGKYWADGTTIDLWRPPNSGAWVQLSAALRAFAPRCVAAGITNIEFHWCQGESNTPNNMAATLPTFEQYTNELFNSVRSLLDGYRLAVHFSVLKTNGNLVTGPNPADVSAASLAFVRAAQDHLAATRTDTTAVSLDTVNLAGNIHYTFGQTNLCGSILAASILSRY